MKETVLKSLAILLAATLAGVSAATYAGADPQQTDTVDCKKNPTDPRCKGKDGGGKY